MVVPPVFGTDVLRIFGDGHDSDMDSDQEDDPLGRGPTVAYLDVNWPAVAVDAVCVHIRGEAEVNISFPVAAELLLPRWEWAATKPGPGHRADPNWLVRHISTRAWELFQESPRGQDLVAGGAQIVRSIRRHKNRLTIMGEDTFCLKEARSDRPAFCIDVVEGGDGDGSGGLRGQVETEWSHAYVAMGLHLSHRSQTSLLARVYNLDLAVCFALAVCEVLRVPVRAGAIRVSEDDAGQRLRTTFVGALERAGQSVDVALGGRPLRQFAPVEVAGAATAASLDECQAFLFVALGSENFSLIGEVVGEG